MLMHDTSSSGSYVRKEAFNTFVEYILHCSELKFPFSTVARAEGSVREAPWGDDQPGERGRDPPPLRLLQLPPPQEGRPLLLQREPLLHHEGLAVENHRGGEPKVVLAGHT